jgi:hypothetical protein
VHELLARAMQGVDPDSPSAFWQVFVNLCAMLPWEALFWWNLLFVLVGALLGWWRGRLWEGVVWAFVLGPFGWLVLWFRPRPRPRVEPPPLRR